jgi:cell wall-associated NlpC family hydrolase
VFTHFNIHVPRSSIDFTDKGREVGLEKALPGDLILFTGTDSAEKFVGHMGLVESRKNDSLYFIHSTSGKAHGVVITSFGKYYASRFVKVIRIFPDGVIQKSAGIERKDSSVLTQ